MMLAYCALLCDVPRPAAAVLVEPDLARVWLPDIFSPERRLMQVFTVSVARISLPFTSWIADSFSHGYRGETKLVLAQPWVCPPHLDLSAQDANGIKFVHVDCPSNSHTHRERPTLLYRTMLLQLLLLVVDIELWTEGEYF